MNEPTLYDLGHLEPFDLPSAITLRAAAKLMRGRSGRPLSHYSAWRFATPHRGCRPAGTGGAPGGVVLVLPAVKIGGELYVMQSWVRAFESARVKLGTRRNYAGVRTPGEKSRGNVVARAYLKSQGVGVGI